VTDPLMDHEEFLALVRYDADGLVPCVVQAAEGGEVLMVAYANEEALRATLACGEATFWSRSRRELWHKGGTSGNVQRVLALRLDCDHDTVLLTVEPAGPACHTGAVSCFHDEASGGAATRPAAGA
jgi:phosphoribosyl-AMP cyclohydrolase